MAKPWKQQALILVAALLLGLSLPVPGSAAPLEEACAGGIERLSRHRMNPSCVVNLLSGSSDEDVGKCCGTLQKFITSEDCACSLQKAFAERKIDVDKVCNLRMTKEECQAKEDAKKAEADAAQQREDELSKLGACDRLFERLAAGERSKISRDNDIMACRQEMKTCPATCQGKQ